MYSTEHNWALHVSTICMSKMQQLMTSRLISWQELQLTLVFKLLGCYCLLLAFLASSFRAFLTDPASSSTSTPAFQHPVLSPMALFTTLSASTASLHLAMFPKPE